MQRETMAADLQKERASISRALAGKTGGGRLLTGRAIDIHETLKREAFASESASCTTHFEKSRPCPNSVYGVSDQHMVLDSFEKVESSRLDIGELQFNFMIQGVTRNQTIGVKDLLDTIIEAQVYPFDIPILPLDDFSGPSIVLHSPGLASLGLTANGPLPTGGDATSNPMTQAPFGGRITMFMQEIGLQSFSDADNRRHHFEFSSKPAGAPSPASPAGDRLALTPLKGGGGRFIFTDPIKDIHGLTLCFYNPCSPIRFPPDCIYNARASADAGQRLQFEFIDPTNLINLAIGDRVFIRGFSPPIALLDSYVTRPEGHIVGAGGWLTLTPTAAGTPARLRLNPDVSVAAYYGANAPIASSTAIRIYIAKNRIRISMRFRRIVGRLTNYIAP